MGNFPKAGHADAGLEARSSRAVLIPGSGTWVNRVNPFRDGPVLVNIGMSVAPRLA